MPLSIRSQSKAPELKRPPLRRLALKLLRAERRPDTLEVSLLICNDEMIWALNKTHRGEDQPTDVLSFPQEEGPPLPLGWAEEEIPHLLGDVAISIETARRQADAHGWSAQEEVEALLVHGLLHLLGYDHDTLEESFLMQSKENAMLGEKSIWSKETTSHARQESAR